MTEHPTMIPAQGVMARSLFWSLVAIGISLVSLALSLYLHGRTGVEYSFLYRDANAIAGNPFYYGLLENLTAVLMISSGSIILFTAMTERWTGPEPFGFSLGMGLLTTVMGLDDLLMLHESAWFIHWRLKEVHVYLVYAALLVFSVACYRRLFLSTPFPLLAMALSALALAGMGDMLELGFKIEDYLEIMGFSFWFSCILATSVTLKKCQTWSGLAFIASGGMSRARLQVGSRTFLGCFPSC